MDKWFAIAAAVFFMSAFGSTAIETSKKMDVKIACYEAQAKTTIDLRCEK